MFNWIPTTKNKEAKKADQKVQLFRERMQEITAELNILDDSLADILREMTPKIDVLETSEAVARAEELLIEHLDHRQRADWKKHRNFQVKGQTMTYQLSEVGKPRIVAGPNKGTALCIVPGGYAHRTLPKGDELLALKFLIEADEAKFLKTANPNWFRPDGTSRRPKDGSAYEPYWARPYDLNQARQNWAYYQNELATTTRRLETAVAAINALPNITATATVTDGNYVDATTFGARNRTYLTGTGPVITVTAGSAEGSWQFRANGPLLQNAWFTPGRAMAGHEIGPLRPEHCEPCRGAYGTLQTIANAWGNAYTR